MKELYTGSIEVQEWFHQGPRVHESLRFTFMKDAVGGPCCLLRRGLPQG